MVIKDKDEKITVRQAAKECGRNPETIRRWIWSGKLAAIRDAFIPRAPTLRRRIHTTEDGRAAFLITRYAAASPWDGTPQDYTDPV